MCPFCLLADPTEAADRVALVGAAVADVAVPHPVGAAVGALDGTLGFLVGIAAGRLRLLLAGRSLVGAATCGEQREREHERDPHASVLALSAGTSCFGCRLPVACCLLPVAR